MLIVYNIEIFPRFGWVLTYRDIYFLLQSARYMIHAFCELPISQTNFYYSFDFIFVLQSKSVHFNFILLILFHNTLFVCAVILKEVHNVI